jgi:hypothetical protein
VLDRRSHAIGERRAGKWADETLEEVALERLRERQLAFLPEDLACGSRRGCLDRVDDLLHGRRNAREVRDVRAVGCSAGSEREGAADIGREVVLRGSPYAIV